MKKSLKTGIMVYFWLSVGSIIAALGISIFLVPYKIAPGGVSGIATVIYYLSEERIAVGTLMLIFNIPLLIGGMKLIGRKFFVRTMFSTILLSVVINETEKYAKIFIENYLTKVDVAQINPELMLYSIFGGSIMGIGLGIVFKYDATTGGSDLAAKIVNHFLPNYTMGQIILLIDTCVVIFATVAFKSVLLGLYSIIALYISIRVIDAVLEGINFSKAVFIISDNGNDIAQKILDDIDRGVTLLDGSGAYTGNEKKVLLCVLERGQLERLRNIVKSIDDKAFIILTDVREVLGEGFKTY